MLGRIVLSLLAGRGLAGRGAIRIWLGTLLLLCASSAIEAQLRSQGGSTLETVTVGQALAMGLGSIVGKLLSLSLFVGGCLLGLFWLFGRPRQSDADEEIREVREHALPTQASVPRRTQILPTRATAPLPVSNPSKNEGTAPVVTPFDYLQRRREPAPASPFDPIPRSIEKSRWPKLPTQQEEPRKVARPASEWAPFEHLRPTEAMLARSGGNRATHEAPAETQLPATQPMVKPVTRPASPINQQQHRVRVSSVSDSGNAITTSLRATLQAQMPPVPPVPPVVAAHPDNSVNSLPSAPAALASTLIANEKSLSVPETVSIAASVSVPAGTSVFAPQPIAVPAADLSPVFESAPAPMQFHNWTMAPSAASNLNQPVAARETAPWQYNSIPLPDIGLLDQGHDAPVEMDATQLQEIGQLIEQRLKEFKVPVTVLGAYAGPVITRFEIEPALGVRGAQIVNLMKDLARALGLTSIRVVETIPGKTCMGLELPNPKRQMIRLAEIIRSDAYTGSASHLTLAMGKDITGVPVATDLARAPHMLVAGTTGSGKSVAINAMILSLLYKATPDDVRLIMIDPKMLELSVYDGIPHLLAPVVTDMKLAAHALSWCVAEMDKRYRLMSALGVRNLAGYNQKIRDGITNEKYVKNPFSLTPDAPEPLDPLPMIVVVIDELADLMMVAGKKIEELIARLAQKARAAGIHLILATQRPSVDVITGLIKANIPTRVAFQVSSKIDSRTVLDQMGAETLLGHGDMLFLPPGSGYPQRVHGAFVSDEEVHRVVEHLKSYGEPQYEEAILAGPASEESQQGEMFGDAGEEADPLYDDAVAYVTRSRRASISSVQRQFRIGYNRAARLVEQMEAAGILSSMSKSGGRDVLAPPPPDL
ncbi:S-DNA-T family DNA segregation ATPase FtsK/SpoIIIE [Herbaspirillum sp. Sphag1AN]|nr:S-DNA-T family DNA segregation ATPase FtsK/SpoIIIE [Herbaspirillum sp. Sphag1AN]MBB3246373.1 S-DNA-T family DNA segregation ATPase FtsK/SpoIIIE [Herbaspirillum sp. Sphag64]